MNLKVGDRIVFNNCGDKKASSFCKDGCNHLMYDNPNKPCVFGIYDIEEETFTVKDARGEKASSIKIGKGKDISCWWVARFWVRRAPYKWKKI